MYEILLSVHSVLRYVVLALLLITIVKSFIGWKGKRFYANGDRRLALFTVISAHTQLLTGLVLYVISPMVKVGLNNMSSAMQDKELRFWTVEHISMMIVAIAVLTIGNSMAKKEMLDENKFRRITLFFALALLIILIAIPWPFSDVARSW